MSDVITAIGHAENALDQVVGPVQLSRPKFNTYSNIHLNMMLGSIYRMISVIHCVI